MRGRREGGRIGAEEVVGVGGVEEEAEEEVEDVEGGGDEDEVDEAGGGEGVLGGQLQDLQELHLRGFELGFSLRRFEEEDDGGGGGGELRLERSAESHGMEEEER